jgi:hypothetical protein
MLGKNPGEKKEEETEENITVEDVFFPEQQ